MKNVRKGVTKCFTPQHYLDLLKFHIEDLQLSGINRILEPACGDGALVTLARNLFTGASIDAVDLDDHGINIVDDFMTWKEVPSQYEPYDLVLMNPPYIPADKKKYLAQMKRWGVSGKNNLYDLFILKSMAHLKDGGIMVALLPSNSVRRDSVPFMNKFKVLRVIESFVKFKGVGIPQYTILILQKAPTDSIEPEGFFDYDKHRVIDYCVIRNEHYDLMFDMRFSRNGWVKLKDVCDCDDRNYGPFIIDPIEQEAYYVKHPQYRPDTKIVGSGLPVEEELC
jgi:type I restriction-modification system DNA methylase subunit